MTGYPDAGDVNPVRENADAVILPTGEVFIEGGLKNGLNDGTGVKRGELYNPATNTWTVQPEAERVRGYHSVALLMPNGAVWVAGSNFNASPALGNRELRIEIFEPWYFCGQRPPITEVALSACHGEDFEIRTPNAGDVQKVVLVRCGTVTHNFNPDQRHVTLEFRRDKGDIVVARVPDNPAVAIVGYYLVFVIDSTGRPSTGRFIQICPGGTRRPRPWLDEDWWEWLRDVLSDGRRLSAGDIRRLRRSLQPPTAPTRRRLFQPGGHGAHGGGHGGGFYGGGHRHDQGDHDQPCRCQDDHQDHAHGHGEEHGHAHGGHAHDPDEVYD